MSSYTLDVPPGAPLNNRPIPVRVGNAHEWACVAVFRVSQLEVDAAAASWAAGMPIATDLALDHECLTTIQGPLCLKCQQPLTPTSHAMPCPVQFAPVLGIAN